MDPPFGLNLETRALELISMRNCIRTGGFVYLETARDAPVIVAGPDWEIAREKTVGEVRLLLLKKI